MTREELNTVRGYVSNIQAIKDAHNTEQLPINYGTICTITANGWKLIEELKSLQQEPYYNPDEWCKTCKEYDQDKHCCPRFNNVIRKTVEEIKRAKIKVGHWIEGQTDNPNIHNILCSCCFEGYQSKGHANSQYNLGYLYEKGQGVSKDYANAVFWYKKAALQGNVEAQFKLGVCYDNGLGVKKNFQEAAKWNKMAAEEGHVTAQYNMGLYYLSGQGVQKDIPRAKQWLTKAAENGHEKARQLLTRIR
jgi:TPR repeat protein